jgi:small subunit ribosomal protein S1
MSADTTQNTVTTPETAPEAAPENTPDTATTASTRAETKEENTPADFTAPETPEADSPEASTADAAATDAPVAKTRNNGAEATPAEEAAPAEEPAAVNAEPSPAEPIAEAPATQEAAPEAPAETPAEVAPVEAATETPAEKKEAAAPAEATPVEAATEAPTETATEAPAETPAATSTDGEPVEEEPELSHEDMEQLIDEYSGAGAPATGEIKPGKVVNVTTDGIVVDIGLKGEGLVPLAEFQDEAGNITTKAGDTFDVLVESSHSTEGYIPCSADGAYRLRLWEHVETAERAKEKVRCRVTGRTKGGFEVDLLFPINVPGHRPMSGFIPGSQMDLRPVRHWEGFLKREIQAQVIRYDRRRGNIVLSRRTLLEAEQVERKKLFEELIVEGASIKGTVKNMTDYGAFVDVGGIDGLLHVTDISYQRLSHPSEKLKNGQEITVKVLKVDKKKERVSLGLKQLAPNPWDTVETKYKVGERVKGRVTHLVDYGAFIELEPGLEGLIHVSELSWTKKIRHPNQMLNEGDGVEAAVLEVQPKEKRVSLGLRQTLPDPFQEVARRFPTGSVIEGKVTSLTDFGAFVEVETGVEGLIHTSELSWNKKNKKASSVVKKGEAVKAKVIQVDILNRRLSLSLKDLTPDPTATWISQHRVDETVKGKPTRKTDFGVFVELAEGVEGLCHISEIPNDDKDSLKKGEEFEFKIVKLTPNDRRIGLSIKAMDAVSMKDYGDSQPRSTATLAEMMKAKGIKASRK